jgi:ergothioneine biosynthesis protein EgtB
MESLRDRYVAVRTRTERLCDSLETEDYVVSSMPDVSPTKWHLAHTTWFFETFVLTPHAPSYAALDPRYAFLFNSYYVQAGERHCRAQRGLVTRPTVADVFAYRRHVDEEMLRLLESFDDADLIELGLNHEQQHQELLLSDIKHVFWTNPMRPSFQDPRLGPPPEWKSARSPGTSDWTDVPEGVREIGHGGDSFSFDNERPVHRVFVEPYAIAGSLVTNGQYREFIEDRGYHRPELWLAGGWSVIEQDRREAPIYWERSDDGWSEFTLSGTLPLDPNAPVCHLSYFEADAFARWAGHRLPTEPEWEIAARLHPELAHLSGERWQWTQSAYLPYPGFRTAVGAIGEYNGKWMSDQWALRGSSCATPPGHSRVTYRNFFPSDTRWQFTGIRLAKSV